MFSKIIICFSLFFSCICTLSAEENFLLINGHTDEKMLELGPNIDKWISPCSTFKIPLSLMGYDAGVLTDKTTPVWDFHEGYDNFLESWKTPQTPQSWITCSCRWYSKILALHLGIEKIQNYVTSMDYGNKDMSGGFGEPGPTSVAWINSSLKISPKEQVSFIQKIVQGKLPISPNAIQMTKTLLFKEELPRGWKLFGKTGAGEEDGSALEHSWFVGWIEKGRSFFPFAYLIRAKKINHEKRIPRVKELLIKSKVMDEMPNYYDS